MGFALACRVYGCMPCRHDFRGMGLRERPLPAVTAPSVLAKMRTKLQQCNAKRAEPLSCRWTVPHFVSTRASDRGRALSASDRGRALSAPTDRSLALSKFDATKNVRRPRARGACAYLRSEVY